MQHAEASAGCTRRVRRRRRAEAHPCTPREALATCQVMHYCCLCHGLYPKQAQVKPQRQQNCRKRVMAQSEVHGQRAEPKP